MISKVTWNKSLSEYYSLNYYIYSSFKTYPWALLIKRLPSYWAASQRISSSLLSPAPPLSTTIFLNTRETLFRSYMQQGWWLFEYHAATNAR